MAAMTAETLKHPPTHGVDDATAVVVEELDTAMTFGAVAPQVDENSHPIATATIPAAE